MRFVTPAGRELAPVTRKQMLEIDRIAVGESGPSLLQMMENAGRSLAELALRILPEPLSHGRVLVVAGPGGNGGGGICGARHLVTRAARVELCLVEPDRLSPGAEAQLAIYRLTDGEETPMVGAEERGAYDLLIDAVIGYGLRGAPAGEAERAIRWMGAARTPVLSLDLPSGLDPDTGETPGVFVAARSTLTLHLPKPGLRNQAAGGLWVADLGIPAEVTQRVGVPGPAYGDGFVVPLERR
jgi:NAD(P)H-hydrate epimerase